MANSFELVERVGISTESMADAIKNIVKETNKEKTVSWFEVLEERGRVTSDGEVEFQVTVKMGIKLD